MPAFKAGVLLCQNCGTAVAEPSREDCAPLPVETLWGTQVPTHQHALTIREQIAALDGEIEAIEATLNSILAAADVVRRRRDEMRYAQEQRISLFAPARRLPAEILSAIFLECVSEPTYTGVWSMQRLYFGQVCHRWREAAISTPRLWTLLSYPRVTAPLLRNVWIPRSNPLPVEVDLWRFHGTSLSKIRDIIETVITASPRWRLASLYVFPQHTDLFTQPLHVPLLRELTLHGALDRRDPHGHAFATAPELRAVQLRELSFHLPWAQLHKVALRTTKEQHIRCLRDCTELQEYTMKFPYDMAGESWTPWVPICHSNLRILELHDVPDLPSLFMNLTVPALVVLAIHDCALSWWTMKPAFFSLLSRSRCRLKTFRLDRWDYLWWQRSEEGNIAQYFQETALLSHMTMKKLYKSKYHTFEAVASDTVEKELL